MSFFDYFRRKQKTATLAKDRLSIIVARERATTRGAPDYLPQLQQELLAVIARYEKIDLQEVGVRIDSSGGCEVLEINRRSSAITGVVTTEGAIATDTVVCAAGAWSRRIGEMLDMTVPVTSVRRQIAFTEPLADMPATSPSLTIDFPSNFTSTPRGAASSSAGRTPRVVATPSPTTASCSPSAA